MLTPPLHVEYLVKRSVTVNMQSVVAERSLSCKIQFSDHVGPHSTNRTTINIAFGVNPIEKLLHLHTMFGPADPDTRRHGGCPGLLGTASDLSGLDL